MAWSPSQSSFRSSMCPRLVNSPKGPASGGPFCFVFTTKCARCGFMGAPAGRLAQSCLLVWTAVQQSGVAVLVHFIGLEGDLGFAHSLVPIPQYRLCVLPTLLQRCDVLF